MSKHSSRPPIDPKLLELMIEQATSGLDNDVELSPALLPDDSLSKEQVAELERLELAAAAFDVALFEKLDAGSELPVEPIPDSLKNRLKKDAERFIERNGRPASSSSRGSSIRDAIEASIDDEDGLDEDPAVERRRSKESESKPDRRYRPGPRSSVGYPITRREVIAFTIAAASILLIFSGLNPLAEWSKPPAEALAMGVPRLPKPAPLTEQLNEFIVSKPADLIDLEFAPVHVKSAGGRVVWSDERQEGYMILTGFEANDRSKEQYQLWIFDTDPKQATPTDGGVFDISLADQNENGEVIVPIRAHVPVSKAVQFAVTVERPGGVTVSDRSRIPVLAAL